MTPRIPQRSRHHLVIGGAAVLATCWLPSLTSGQVLMSAKSGAKPWVDLNTPADKRSITSSRGDNWELVMSDEFNVPGRDFSPGKDHLWTALELPDGVNSALEYYSINMTSTTTDDHGNGVFQIKITNDEVITFKVFNAYKKPSAGYQNYTMFYRAGMVQSWNKFCFQGGLMEVRAQLPGAVSKKSNNPDLGDEQARVKTDAFYPTWPGIWLLGNLGRALFTESTNRIWPWSYDTCDKDLAKDQRINGCDSSPGFGLNKNQGRGAPEIDLLEGGGVALSTSIQVAPGMPDDFRLIPVDPKVDENKYCVYGRECKTPGANIPGAPTKLYDSRGHKTWYQGLRYAPNTNCRPVTKEIQDPTQVKVNARQITSNTCNGTNLCPASMDGYSDLGLIDGKGPAHWGVNEKGGCMPIINGYMGSYLCDPDSTDKRCTEARRPGYPKSNLMKPFNYQMDAVSANTGLPLKAYTGYVIYQVEWVMGNKGYIRWVVDGVPIYEIPSESIVNPPQDPDRPTANPKKIMIEEPMYVIFNVALSTSWGAKPPNPEKPCWGDRNDQTVNSICDDFPLYMRIDYIRVYQDTSKKSKMSVGCSPTSHPTKEWIEGHKEEFFDANNPIKEVAGGATCAVDDDCTVDAAIVTGRCSSSTRTCSCFQPNTWGGPRCTLAMAAYGGAMKGFGPSFGLALAFGCVVLVVVVFLRLKKWRESGSVTVSGYDTEREEKRAQLIAASSSNYDDSLPDGTMHINRDRHLM